MKKIELLLGSKMTKQTQAELKRQKVPRAKIANGIDLAIYRSNGWTEARKDTTEREELDMRLEFAKEHASPKGFELLSKMCHLYEQENPFF